MGQLCRTNPLRALIDQMDSKRSLMQGLTYGLADMARAKDIKRRARFHDLKKKLRHSPAALPSFRAQRITNHARHGFLFKHAPSILNRQVLKSSAANRAPDASVLKH